MDRIEEVKKKREFSKLPDSIVGRALEKSERDVKDARAFLRKYFGVFLTNKVLKGVEEEVLGSHASSKNRDYEEFYGKIFERIGEVSSIIDLGCGVNGFSYPFLKKILGRVSYIGVEASGQVADNVNFYFVENNFDGKVFCGDLFDLDFIEGVLKKALKPRVVFMLQVIDALESFEKDFSKKFLKVVRENCEYLVVSWSKRSISGKKRFDVSRKWLVDFLKDNFMIEKDFENWGERFLVLNSASNEFS